MQTMSNPPIGLRIVATSILLLLLGQTAIAGAAEPARELNVPPEGFTALFNGRDLAGWHTPPLVKDFWSIESGVLKSHGLLDQWGADLATKEHYRDFVLMFDFRMPTISDSGINFRRLIPEIPGFGDQEQFNLRSKGGMGHLESYYFLPKDTAEKVGLKEEEKPHLRHIDPEVGVWHTVKLTMKGRTFSAEYDGEVLHDNFVYHDWMMNMEPAPIRLQKHIVVDGDNLGKMNPCPIEYRNIFIKELGPDDVEEAANSRTDASESRGQPDESPLAELLARIDDNSLPDGYDPFNHQPYVDRRMAELSEKQRGKIGQLWKRKEQLDPDMPNRGYAFVKILTYVADGKLPPATASTQEPELGTEVPAQHPIGAPAGRKVRPTADLKPVNRWKWSAETNAEGVRREAMPIKISEEQTIYVVSFGVSEGDNPPVVLLPDSHLRVRGHIATAAPVRFGISINHPNGDFAGRFQNVCPADEFQGGGGFEFTLALQDLQLEPSLAEIRDTLPSAPFHFVVESVWFHSLDKQAGLEIGEVELIPPSEAIAKGTILEAVSDARAKNWHQWRGPEANGVSRTATPPVEWSEDKNVKWKVAIDGKGSSTPIIWGERVFLLTVINTGKVDPSFPKPEDQPQRVFGIKYPNTSHAFVVLCLDRNTGKEVWRQTATERVPHEGTHGDADFASASPTTDGERLYCWFGSAGMYCYALDGQELWQRDLGKAYVEASLGEASSPVVHESRVVIVRDHARQSSIEVLDAKTGQTLWKKDRDETNSWATPRVIEHGARTQVITAASNMVRSYDLASGEIIWQCSGLTGNVIPCPVVEGDVVYCMSGYQGYALLALPLTEHGDISGSDRIVWSRNRGTPYIPSPLLYDGMLYFSQSNDSILSCLDSKSGDAVFERTRLSGLTSVYASPVGADGRVYFTSRNGTTLVLKRSNALEVMATNVLNDVFSASPALVGDQLVLRGRKSLYCIEE